MEDLLSASEIAALKLPALPATKVGIRAFAERDGWYSETRTGVGGTRRVYRLPSKYVPGAKSQVAPGQAVSAVAGAISGGVKANPQLLAMAVRALEEWANEQGISILPERKGAIIAVLYDYLEKGADQGEIKNLLTLVG